MARGGAITVEDILSEHGGKLREHYRAGDKHAVFQARCLLSAQEGGNDELR